MSATGGGTTVDVGGVDVGVVGGGRVVVEVGGVELLVWVGCVGFDVGGELVEGCVEGCCVEGCVDGWVEAGVDGCVADDAEDVPGADVLLCVLVASVGVRGGGTGASERVGTGVLGGFVVRVGVVRVLGLVLLGAPGPAGL